MPFPPVPRVLLTGFEPFGPHADNPSALVADSLAQAPPPGIALRTAILPNSFDRASATLHRLLDRDPADAVLMLGLAGGRAGLTVERVAVNLRDARIPDNDGDQPIDAPCIQGAPTAYLSTLPVKRMVAAIRAAGIEASLSHSAGTFVCNHLLFTALHRAATGDAPAPAPACAFLHLPFLPHQVPDPSAPAMALADQVRGVAAVLGALLPDAAVPLDAIPAGALW